MTNTWIVEVANANERLLTWLPAGASAAASTFANDIRKFADNLAIALQAGLGHNAVVRVRGTAPNRGSFYPAPRPARSITAL